MTSETWPAKASLETLEQRAQLLKTIRQFFDTQKFIEVETPLLSRDTVIDQYLDPIAVTLPNDPRHPQQGKNYWLQTSPEFCMKRLLASGADAIYQICKAFRAGETGRLHNPEFTMVEWYRTGDDMHAGMELLSELADLTLKRGLAQKLTYQNAFLKYADVDPHEITGPQLMQRLIEMNIDIPASITVEDHDGLLDLLLVEKVQPHLGTHCPVILYNYPATQAALAQVRGTNPAVAQRFELYVKGIELANGYCELLDPALLQERNQKTNQLRINDGKPPLPEASHLLEAMQHGLPACAGVALGLDRLAMLAIDKQSIDEVLAFPIDRA
ncbi:MAG: EF-P lysine aminoacylase GenX [Blastopirellula sp.]|nr:MAG: EF-P lysine aminoacylase GenX [Blastopirellula sp.]